MSDRELMQQALEALNRSDYLGWQVNIPIIKALRERLAQPSPDEVIASHAKRLALELEGVLLECHDTSATSKWWNSAYQAIHNFHDDIDWLYPQEHVSPLGKD
jgi:hypothetical protein